MITDINTIVLSGEVGWIKKGYSANKSLYVIFSIKQPNVEYRDEKFVGRSYDVYFISCFEEVAVRLGNIKEGEKVVMHGHITPYIKGDKTSINIVADRVVRYGNKNNDNAGS